MTAAATLGHDVLLPQPPGGNALGALLALGAHALLGFALVAMTQWRTQAPEVISAELWASVPEAAAPAAAAAPPPAPLPAPAPVPAPKPAPAPAAAEPPPPKVDIATERAERARVERERREAEAEAARRRKAEAERARREQDEQVARRAAAEQERADRAREDQLRRMMSQAGTAAGAGSASAAAPGSAVRDAALSASYSARLVTLIRSNTVFSGDVPGNPAAEVEVRAAASGTILSRRLLKSSGHPAWDDAVLRAIDRVGTLPRDTDGRVPPTLIVAFRPKE